MSRSWGPLGPWASPAGPFGSEELRGVDELDPEDAAIELEIGRALERLAARDGGLPSAPFADRVMTAIAAEPRPAPAAAAAAAARQGRWRAFVASLVDAWRVAFGGGRPALVRVQAFAIVGLLVVALSGATIGAGAALGLLDGANPTPVVPSPSPSPLPSVTPSPSITPSPSPTPSLSDSPSPSPSEEPSATPTQTDDETPEPAESDDHGGGSGGNSGPGGGDDATERPTDDSGGGSDESGGGSDDSGSGSDSGSRSGSSDSGDDD